MDPDDCPGEEELKAYALGTLLELEARRIEQHIQVCPGCETRVDSFDTKADRLIAEIRSQPSEDSYLEEPQCQAAVAKAKLLAERIAAQREMEPPQDPRAAEAIDLDCLGDYRVLASLGRGAMGRVFKAQQRWLKKTVAVKVLAKEHLGDPRLVARFTREMGLIGQLDHPNIVLAHDAREIEGARVLVMEYVDGKDLARTLDAVGRLGIPEACEIVRQTACGLQYVCQRGLIHRDVKPSNLMLSRKGQVKILDLGLALLRAEPREGDQLTSPGTAVGTADYMAPEQAVDSRRVDIRADIYSLGCTLYKLLTGCAPFEGRRYATQAEKLVGHLRESPPPLAQLRPGVPPELAAVVERMMAKTPADRFATPAAVAEAISPFAIGAKLEQLAAEAFAADEEAATAGHASSGTDPQSRSASVDTDAVGLLAESKAAAGIAQPKSEASHSGCRQSRFGLPRKVWLTAAVAVAAFLVLGTIVILQTRNGLLTVEMDDPTANLQVRGERNEIAIERSGQRGSITMSVPPGKWKLLVRKDGEVKFSQDFTLAAGGQDTIQVPPAPPEQTVGPRVAASSPHWTPQQQERDDRNAKERQEVCARRLRVPVEISNSIGMKLVLIPSGEFLMGSTKQSIEDETRLRNHPWYSVRLPGECPQHLVRISRPFRIGITEVTQEQYQRLMGGNPSEFKNDARGPVERVSWNDCTEFCRRLSELPAEKAARRRYVLPTEAQWEYACRAGSTVPLQSAADALDRGKEELALMEVAWFGLNSNDRPHPVGQKRPNGFGLADMYGNVTEWCADWYAADYYAKSPVDDPAGPAKGTDRVQRGGSWFNPPYGCRLTFRAFFPPGTKGHDLGFRVVQIEPGGLEMVPSPPPIAPPP